MKPPISALPANTDDRIRALVQRSAPDPARPRLQPEHELAFSRVDAESAACYASAEDLSHRLRAVAAKTEEIASVLEVDDEDDA